MGLYFVLQVFPTQDFAAANRMGFQVVPDLFIRGEFRAVGRQEIELEFAAITLLALLTSLDLCMG